MKCIECKAEWNEDGVIKIINKRKGIIHCNKCDNDFEIRPLRASFLMDERYYVFKI